MKKRLFALTSLLVLGLSACNSVQKYPDSVLNSGWGKEAAIASYEALGVAVPYIQNDGFEYETGVDAYGDPTIAFYVFYNTDEAANNAFDEYIGICEYYGYSGEVSTKTYIDYDTYTIYQYESCIVDRVIQEHHGIELEFLVSIFKEKPCLGIFGFTYLYIDENEYPLLALEELYGKDASMFPVIDEKGAKYSFQFFIDQESQTEALEVVVSNVSYDIEEWYFEQILSIQGVIIYQCNDYDESYQAVTEYPGYNADGTYYYCLVGGYTVIFEFDLYNYYAFVIEFFTVQ